MTRADVVLGAVLSGGLLYALSLTCLGIVWLTDRHDQAKASHRDAVARSRHSRQYR